MSILIKLLLPAPFEPMRPKISPCVVVIDTWDTATSSPKLRLKLEVSIAGAELLGTVRWSLTPTVERLRIIHKLISAIRRTLDQSMSFLHASDAAYQLLRGSLRRLPR